MYMIITIIDTQRTIGPEQTKLIWKFSPICSNKIFCVSLFKAFKNETHG